MYENILLAVNCTGPLCTHDGAVRVFLSLDKTWLSRKNIGMTLVNATC